MPNQDDLLKEVATFGQTCLEKFPVIVLGSGSSIPYDLPSMDKLKSEIGDISLQGEMVKHQPCLDKLKEELKSKDLETALSSIDSNNELQNLIRTKIWKVINDADLRLRDQLLSDTSSLSLIKLFNHQLRSTNNSLSIVTTNYDRVAEYAADLTRHFWFTGFTHGHIWTLKDLPETLNIRARIQAGHDKYIQVWKVHGSLDWFKPKEGDSVKAAPNCANIPCGFLPCIIPPKCQQIC